MNAMEIRAPMMASPIVSSVARVSVIILGCLSCLPFMLLF